MRTIGMLLGIPEADQVAIRERIDEGLRLEQGAPPDVNDPAHGRVRAERALRRVHRLAGREPVRRPHDRPAQRRVRGHRRRAQDSSPATRCSATSASSPAAGNETTTRLIGWTGKVLAEHPDQRQELVEDRSLVPGAIEELLRFEAPSPVQARYVTKDVEQHGQTVPEGSVMVLLNASAQPRRPARSPTATPSTSTARSTTTCPSATASTSASAPRWPGSRAASPSTRCSSASRRGRSTGTTPSRPAPPRCAAGRRCRSGRAERWATARRSRRGGTSRPRWLTGTSR